MVEEGGKALAAYLKPREEGQVQTEPADEITDVVKTLGQVAEYWLSDPQRAVELQSQPRQGLSRSVGRGGQAPGRRDGRAGRRSPIRSDKRFADPEWSSNQFFDFLKQAYLLTAQWADHLVEDAEGLDPHTRQKAEFYVRQIANAVVAVELRADQSGAAARDARRPTPRTSCAACTCWPRTSRPAAATSRSASPTPSKFEVGRTSRSRPAR